MSTNRDNLYYEKRLKKEGRIDLLDKVTSGEISMFRATLLAGYRNKKPRDNAEALSRRWYRLSEIERLKFVNDHFDEIAAIAKKRRELIGEQQAAKAGK